VITLQQLCDLPIVVLVPVAGVLLLACWMLDKGAGRS